MHVDYWLSKNILFFLNNYWGLLMGAEAKISYDLKRFAGIKRDYTPEDVERLRGSIKIEYSMCKLQSN